MLKKEDVLRCLELCIKSVSDDNDFQYLKGLNLAYNLVKELDIVD